jgi:hypothetical protein
MFVTDASWWRVGKDPVGFWLRTLKYAIALVVGLAVAGVQNWRKRRLEEAAENWPAVEATIQYTDVKGITDSTDFEAVLTYSYFAGKYRSGKYSAQFASEDDANSFAAQVKDKKVQIRYNPARPDKSLLEDYDVQQDLPPDSSPVQSIP